ncbi:19965_t:CDS:2, partial [Gigaspora rosea]
MKALIEYHAWSGDKEPNECAKCDNCNRLEELLRVVEVLTTTRSNAARMKKFGYQQLEEFYDQQDIKKSKKPKLLEFMSCTLVIEGLVDSAKEIVKAQEWKYW